MMFGVFISLMFLLVLSLVLRCVVECYRERDWFFLLMFSVMAVCVLMLVFMVWNDYGAHG